MRKEGRLELLLANLELAEFYGERAAVKQKHRKDRASAKQASNYYHGYDKWHRLDKVWASCYKSELYKSGIGDARRRYRLNYQDYDDDVETNDIQFILCQEDVNNIELEMFIYELKMMGVI